MQFRLKDPEPLLFHNEAILRDGKIVGTDHVGQLRPPSRRRRSGLAMCRAEGESEAEVLSSSYEIEIAGERFAAEASLKPMYDPKAERCG